MRDEHTLHDTHAWLTAVDRRWRDVGLPRRVRIRLRLELEGDVGEAIEAGAGARDIIGEDPELFADQVATEHGYEVAGQRNALPNPAGVVATALVGAAIGAFLVWFGFWPLLLQVASRASDATLMWLCYSVGAIVVLLGSVIALSFQLGRSAVVAEIGPALVGLIFGSLIGLAPTLAISRALDYPTQPVLVLIEAVPVVACAAGSILLARLVAARHRRT